MKERNMTDRIKEEALLLELPGAVVRSRDFF